MEQHKAREAVVDALMLVGCGNDPAKVLCVALSKTDAIQGELETETESG